MAFLFGGRGRQKQPAEIARSLKELLSKLAEPSPNPKVSEGTMAGTGRQKDTALWGILG